MDIRKDQEEEGSHEVDVVVMTSSNRAEIDTRPPFQSVKEAVTLFGERVLAGQVYANKLKQMKSAANENGNGMSRLGNVTAELEETKQDLEKARKESMLMANCLSTLKEELEHTKIELQQLKARDVEKERMYSDMEDLKFIEQSTKVEVIKSPIINKEETKYEDKKYVKFASPPLLAQVMSPEYSEEVLDRHPTLMKKKKKTPLMIPLIGGIFNKKGNKVRAP
ncbi:Web family protein [Thalictrum thalictroides]|uniref:Web family protein n=1 Tax=Thalictrum thalictroides TaxID=46969 RepID=A0A7J6WLP6_THATH|nr:Web family protein [Thalictrum thalictroides]